MAAAYSDVLDEEVLCSEVAAGAFCFKNKIRVASVRVLWEKMCLMVAETLRGQKGVLLPNLGNFRVGPVVGETKKKIRPVFSLLEGRYGAVAQERPKYVVGGRCPISQPNFGLLATVAGVHRGACQRLVAELLQRLGVHILSGRPIKVRVPGVGRMLTNRQGRFEFVFDPLFAEFFEREHYALIKEMPLAPEDYQRPSPRTPYSVGTPLASPLVGRPASSSPPAAGQRDKLLAEKHAPYKGGLLELHRLCKTADRINSGCVPRLRLEEWLHQECRALLTHVDAATLMDLLDRHTHGKAAKLIAFKPFLDALEAALAPALSPRDGVVVPPHLAAAVADMRLGEGGGAGVAGARPPSSLARAPGPAASHPAGPYSGTLSSYAGATYGDNEFGNTGDSGGEGGGRHQGEEDGPGSPRSAMEASVQDLVVRQPREQQQQQQAQVPPRPNQHVVITVPQQQQPVEQQQPGPDAFVHYLQRAMSPRSRAQYDEFNRIHFENLYSSRGPRPKRAVTPKVGEEMLNVREFQAVRHSSPPPNSGRAPRSAAAEFVASLEAAAASPSTRGQSPSPSPAAAAAAAALGAGAGRAWGTEPGPGPRMHAWGAHPAPAAAAAVFARGLVVEQPGNSPTWDRDREPLRQQSRPPLQQQQQQRPPLLRPDAGAGPQVLQLGGPIPRDIDECSPQPSPQPQLRRMPSPPPRSSADYDILAPPPEPLRVYAPPEREAPSMYDIQNEPDPRVRARKRAQLATHLRSAWEQQIHEKAEVQDALAAAQDQWPFAPVHHPTDKRPPSAVSTMPSPRGHRPWGRTPR